MRARTALIPMIGLLAGCSAAPVAQDGRVAVYRCDDDPSALITAVYRDTDPPTVVVTRKSRSIVMTRQPAASGARYGADGEMLWEHHGEARVIWGARNAETRCDVVRP